MIKEIKYIDLSSHWKKESSKLIPIINRVLLDGNWVGGEEILKFEKNIAKFCNKRFAVALNSGTDALTFGLSLLGVRKNDEVITIPNSFIASTSSIVHLGAKPVFVDVLNDQNINPNLIEKAITKKTKAIMPVHLTGRISDMDSILSISKKYNIPIIEDAAQSIGSLYKNRPSGSFGKVGCFSAHPLKNLNAIGDSGYLVTDDSKIYHTIKDLSNHGMTNRNKIKNFGYVSRMDNIQAAVLNYRLKSLKKKIEQRRKNAQFYLENLDKNFVFVPEEKSYEYNTYHTFVIQVDQRDKLKKYLKKNKINTGIHYPIPIHLQPASRRFNYKKGDFPVAESQSKRILTLPIHNSLSLNDLTKIVEKIDQFFKKS